MERHRGTAQGSAVSPVLANLFLHWALDAWMTRAFPGVPFERYADDGVIHCRDSDEARRVLAALTARMAEVGLELHPDKTRVVYCQDSRRRGDHPHTSFTFLGFEFRQRRVRTRRLHLRTDLSESDIARWINPVVRGWMQYYGAFYRSELYPLLGRINSY